VIIRRNAVDAGDEPDWSIHHPETEAEARILEMAIASVMPKTFNGYDEGETIVCEIQLRTGLANWHDGELAAHLRIIGDTDTRNDDGTDGGLGWMPGDTDRYYPITLSVCERECPASEAYRIEVVWDMPANPYGHAQSNILPHMPVLCMRYAREHRDGLAQA